MNFSNWQRYILLLGVNFSLLFYHVGSFLGTENLAGRDLVGAYSLVKNFGFEWSTEWFLGVPMFQFYPPGFFAVVKGAGFVLGDLLAFKIFVFSSIIFLPLVVYYTFSNLFDRTTGIVAGVLGISLVFLREPFSLIYQTLQVGLVAQTAAFLLFILFVSFLWDKSRGSAYLSALLLGIMFLVHPFIGLVAVLYVMIYFILERDLLNSLAALLGLALSGWWLLPAIEKLWYMQTYVGPSGQFMNWPWLFIPFLLLDRGRKAVSFVILGFLLLFIGTFEFGINFQFYRFFIYGQMITILASAPGIVNAFARQDKVNAGVLAVTVVFVSVLIPALGVSIEPHWKSDVSLQGVVPENGRVIVETSHSDLYDSYVPIQMMPLKSNVSVVNGLYADSSISSSYLLGLEKSFAENPVPNPIAIEANLTQSQIKERMRYFNISYALVRTDTARKRLGFMRLEVKNKDFKLLSWTPQPRNSIEAVRICTTREKWDKLNRYIFRNNLDLKPVLDCRDGENVSSSTSEVIRRISDMELESVELERESIRAEESIEAIFHLSVEE